MDRLAIPGSWEFAFVCGSRFCLKSSNRIVFHGWGETRDVLSSGGTLNFDTDLALIFGAGFAKHHKGAQGLRINPRNQEGFPGIQFLPKLSNLNLSRAHRRQ